VIPLVNDGHKVATRAAGVADLRSKRPLRPRDRFRAGSITKLFVASVALPALLAEMTTTVPSWKGTDLRYGLGLLESSPSRCGRVLGIAGDSCAGGS
jgi:hypothetical protein